MLTNDILYNNKDMEWIEARQIASKIEQDLKALNIYSLEDVGNKIDCDLTEEDLLFLETMGF